MTELLRKTTLRNVLPLLFAFIASSLGGCTKNLADNPPTSVAAPTPTSESTTRKSADPTKVALEPSTGRPHRARTDVVGEVNGKKRIEVLDTLFHWESAQGCGLAF